MQRNRMGRFVRRGSARRSVRRRRHRIMHINPSPRRRRSGRRRRHLSVAVRRKISRALRRGSSTPRRARRRVRRVSARRRRSGAIRHYRRSVPRGYGVVRRTSYRVIRRRAHRNPGFGSLMGSLKSSFSKPLLMKAGGAVAASFGTGWILSRFGATLPMAQNKYGRVIYTLGIPVVGAFLIRKQNRDFAEGMVIGGLVMTINTLMQGFRTAAAATVGDYAVSGELGNGNFGVAGELGGGSFGYYPQSFNDPRGLGGANVAFPASAW